MNAIQKVLNAMQKVFSIIQRTFAIAQEIFRIGVRKVFSLYRVSLAITRKALTVACKGFKAGAQWILSIIRQTLIVTQNTLATIGRNLSKIIYSIFEVAVTLTAVASAILITAVMVKYLPGNNEQVSSPTDTFVIYIVSLIMEVIGHFSTNITINLIVAISYCSGSIIFALLCATKAHEKGRKWLTWLFVGLIFNFLGYLAICTLFAEIKVNTQGAIIAIQRAFCNIVNAIWKTFLVVTIILAAMAGIAFFTMKVIEKGLSENNEVLVFTFGTLILSSPIIFAFLCASLAHKEGRRWWVWLLIGLIFNFVGYVALSVFRERQPNP